MEDGITIDRTAPIVAELRDRATALDTPRDRLEFVANAMVAVAQVAIFEGVDIEDMKKAAFGALFIAANSGTAKEKPDA
jgi:hypothetical protein